MQELWQKKKWFALNETWTRGHLQQWNWTKIWIWIWKLQSHDYLERQKDSSVHKHTHTHTTQTCFPGVTMWLTDPSYIHETPKPPDLHSSTATHPCFSSPLLFFFLSLSLSFKATLTYSLLDGTQADFSRPQCRTDLRWTFQIAPQCAAVSMLCPRANTRLIDPDSVTHQNKAERSWSGKGDPKMSKDIAWLIKRRLFKKCTSWAGEEKKWHVF